MRAIASVVLVVVFLMMISMMGGCRGDAGVQPNPLGAVCQVPRNCVLLGSSRPGLLVVRKGVLLLELDTCVCVIDGPDAFFVTSVVLDSGDLPIMHVNRLVHVEWSDVRYVAGRGVIVAKVTRIVPSE